MVTNSVVLILEARRPDERGDLSIFADSATAERTLEPIDIQNEEFYGYTLTGRKLSFAILDGRVSITEADAEPTAHDISLVRKWLEDAVKEIPPKRIGTTTDISSCTTDELVTLIGFRR